MIVIDLEAVVELIVKMLATLFVVSIGMFVPAKWLNSILEDDLTETICTYSAVAFVMSIVGFLVLFVIAVLHSIWSA